MSIFGKFQKKFSGQKKYIVESHHTVIFAFLIALSQKMATKTNSRTRSASSSSSSPPAKRQKITVTPFAASFPRRTLLSSSRWVDKVPHDIWVYKILNPFLDLKALATVGRCNTFFQEYWQYVVKQNVIRVPQGCPTVEKAMAVAVVFSAQKVYTSKDPLKIVLDKGVHEIVGDQNGRMVVTCSHITFVGKSWLR